MTLQQWDVVLYPYPAPVGPHPAVIISPNSMAGNPDHKVLNALVCTSVRLNRSVHPNEVALDEADGLDWRTACKCSLVTSLDREKITLKKGHVTVERRRQIGRKVIELFGLLS
ncbi:MAG: type II toxin-antitoxin system PemK/MazF family toxin [Verrucomicrobiota bacterium]